MKTKKIILLFFISIITNLSFAQFTSGRLVVVQTSGATSKFGSAVTLKEYTTAGTSGTSISLPTTGLNPVQMAATLGGSEGFLSQSTDGTSLVFGGYATTADYSATDITASTGSSVPRAIYKVDANGTFSKIYASTTSYSANDIRAAISDGTNYWAGGASVASVDGINYFGPSTAVNFGATATPIKAYGLRIFNGQMYYSTQKAGPSNTASHLGIFSVGSGLPTSGSPTITQIIDMGATNTPADFSFNSTSTICYVAVNLNTAAGGIQKWTKSGSTWTLQYTLGTGVTNIGAYGLTVDYSGSNPIIYATTSESTVGNRIIKITDSGSGSTATNLVTATTNVWFHGLDFSPCIAPTISSISSSAVCQGNTLALNLSTTGTSPLTYSWTGPNSFTSSVQNPTISNATTSASGTYSLTVTNACGTSSSSVTGTVNPAPSATITASGATTMCSGNSVTLTASTGTSYLWSTGETTQAIQVNSTGNYSVAVTNSSACTTTSSVTSVQVNSIVTPTLSITANTGNTICSGSTVTFTATPTNGGNSPIYQWKLNGNNVGTNSSTFSSNSLVNNDIISCELTSNASCVTSSSASSNAITMTVGLSVTPTLSISSDLGTTICDGSSPVFTANASNGGNNPSYQWQLNGNNVGSNNSIFSSNSLSNNDIITCILTSNNACASPTTANSNSLTMTVNSLKTPSLNISSNNGNVICSGVNTTFTAIPTNGGSSPSYQWKLNGTNIGSNSSIFITNSLTNNDVVTCLLSSNISCTTAITATSNAINFTVNSNPTTTITGNLVICSGSSTTLDAGAGFTSYLWSNGATTQTISTGEASTYTVTVTNANCSTTSQAVSVDLLNVPNQPSDFTSSTSLVSKSQSNVVYTIPNDPNVTYNWSYSGGVGATINGNGNSVTIDFAANATSGILHVSASNTCGAGTEKTINITVNSSDFTPGRLVVLQTIGSVSKASNQMTLKEIASDGTPGITVLLPTTGINPIQTAGAFGGSEGFLSTSTDGKFIAVAGYGTSSAFVDITATSSSVVPRVVGKVTASGQYQQISSSNTFYSLNDIRTAVSDGTNFWIGGASTANVDGIDYMYPGTPVALATSATPVKPYSLKIFNNQIYYSTQKAGPSNTATQLGIFALGSGLPTTGSVAPTQIINTGSLVPQDFSFNTASTVCYIAVSLNTSSGGIQKWTKNNGVWSLQYTLGTGTSNIGAYGLYVDYSNANPIVYATTFEATGNRVIKITDTGVNSVATTIVSAVAGTFYKGITFTPSDSGIPTVNLSISATTGSEAGTTAITVTANSSSTLTNNETVDVLVSGTNITSGDYTLSNTTITIPAGASSGSVTFTVVDDALAEGTEVATVSISNPTVGLSLGTNLSQNITILDNDNTIPTISINVLSTSNSVDGGLLVSPASPLAISATLGDNDDPLLTQGINFTINDAETIADNLIVTVTSSNLSILPQNNIVLTGTSSTRLLKVTPFKVGYSNIIVTVSDGLSTANYIINYACSDSIPKVVLSNTLWHTGISDASDAIELDGDYYMTADDEVDVVNVYSRKHSGLPLVSFNFSRMVNLPDTVKPEVDTEAGARSPKHTDKVYWMGSMSTGKAPFDLKPNRDRIVCTSVSGTGAATSINYAGYTAIKSALLTWGDSHGYNFTASAAAGVDSKTPSGFAAEGMVFGPDSTTLWIGLRAPLVPNSNRTKAVLAPILNFETWFNNGSQTGNPTFGAPIELDLGRRGIRDIIRLKNGNYVIVAGNPGSDTLTSAIFKWTGNISDAPIMINTAGNGVLNMEGVMEIQDPNPSNNKLQIISDGGDALLYGDGLEAKSFTNLNLRKFRSDVLTSFDLCIPKTTKIIVDNTLKCADDQAVLHVVNPDNHSSYTWSNTSTGTTIDVTNFGTYTVTRMDANNCTHPSATAKIGNILKTDINNSGVCNVNDFLQLVSAFNQSCTLCAEDINNDGVVNVNDFLLIAADFNRSCALNSFNTDGSKNVTFE